MENTWDMLKDLGLLRKMWGDAASEPIHNGIAVWDRSVHYNSSGHAGSSRVCQSLYWCSGTLQVMLCKMGRDAEIFDHRYWICGQMLMLN